MKFLARRGRRFALSSSDAFEIVICLFVRCIENIIFFFELKIDHQRINTPTIFNWPTSNDIFHSFARNEKRLKEERMRQRCTPFLKECTQIFVVEL